MDYICSSQIHFIMSAELHFKSAIKRNSPATDRYHILIWQQSGSFIPSTIIKHEGGGGSKGVSPFDINLGT